MRYLSDLLSLLRFLGIAPVIIFSLEGRWTAATLMLLLAWATDLLDGAAAHRFGSLRDRWPDLDSDGIADSVLAFGSSAIPVIYYYAHGEYFIAIVLTVVYIVTVAYGIAMVRVMNDEPTPTTRMIVRVNMIVMHSFVQIAGTLCWFAYMAVGEVGACLVFIGMLVVALLQSSKLELWMKGVLR